MKILMISNMYPSEDYPSYGVFVKNFESCLVKNNLKVDKIILTKTDSKIIKILKYLKYYFEIIFRIVTKKYDIVYVHYISHNAIPLIIAKKIKKFNLWINVHGSDIMPYKPSQYKLQKYVKNILPKANKVVVPSTYYKELIVKKFLIEKNNIDVIASGGINNKIFKEINKELVYDYKIRKNIDTSKIIIGCISRLEPKKGWDVFLKAIAKLDKLNQLEDKLVVFVGNGSEYNKFKLLIKELKIEKYILHFELMPQEELGLMYNAIDIFCFTSLQESLGLIPIECMACGTNIISSDIEATKEYMNHNINGLTFEAGNYEELASKLIQFFNMSENKKIEFSEEGKKIAMKYYKSNVEEEIRKIFESWEK